METPSAEKKALLLRRLEGQIRILEYAKRVGAPAIHIFNCEARINQTRLESGEYKSISGNPEDSGNNLALV